MSEQYLFSIENDFPNQKVATDRLTNEINSSDIKTALSSINTDSVNCIVLFKDVLSVEDSTSLDIIISEHTGVPLPRQTAPVRLESPAMSDGRPIIRADSRPLDFQTYYTMAGDDSTAGIGGGTELVWDFSNSDNIVTGSHVPSGMKCKEFIVTFLCPIYTKDGAIYFFDAPWGCYIMMDIVIPPGQWYPNPAGTVPAAMLGLSDGLMYANTGADWVVWTSYVMRYRIHGDCSMGDELNAEGSAINPIPIGWGVRGRVYTLDSDNISKGYAELECHRCHAALLPGMTVADLVAAH